MEMTMPRRTQISAEVEPELYKALKKKLIDDGLTIRAWIEQQARSYVSSEFAPDDKPKKKRKKRVPLR